MNNMKVKTGPRSKLLGPRPKPPKPQKIGMKVYGIRCNHCGDIIYSRCRHDCHYCSCEKVGVDGGFDYMRIMFHKLEDYTRVEIELPKGISKKDLYNDWNEGKEVYGWVNSRYPPKDFNIKEMKEEKEKVSEEIVNDYIKKKDLVWGWYKGKGRNSNVAFWTGETFLTIGPCFGDFSIKDEGLYKERGGCFSPLERIEGGERGHPSYEDNLKDLKKEK